MYKHLGLYELNFRVEEKSTSQGLPYDFESIMHYQNNTFSTSLEKLTLLPKNANIPSSRLGISQNGTTLDFLHVNILYCGGKF